MINEAVAGIPYKKGDVICLGWKRRGLLQWIRGESPEPQWWRIMEDGKPGGMQEMEELR